MGWIGLGSSRYTIYRQTHTHTHTHTQHKSYTPMVTTLNRRERRRGRERERQGKRDGERSHHTATVLHTTDHKAHAFSRSIIFLITPRGEALRWCGSSHRAAAAVGQTVCVPKRVVLFS